MILIGSRAAKFWFYDFREPNDYDLIATKEEVDEFKVKHAARMTRLVTKNHHTFIKVDGDKYQFEIPGIGNESSELITGKDKYRILGTEVLVAEPEVLLALKTSHVYRPLKQKTWEKHIRDYLFLKENTKITPEVKPLLDIRRYEVEQLAKTRKPNLNMSNEEFFEGSEYLIKRIYVHDDLHEAVKFGNTPLYKKIKHDQNKAQTSRGLFERLTHEERINTVREEAFVIALERKVIPYGWDGEEAFKWALYRICTTLTGGWFRKFAVENYLEIVNTDCDFVSKFEKVKSTLRRRN